MINIYIHLYIYIYIYVCVCVFHPKLSREVAGESRSKGAVKEGDEFMFHNSGG